MLKFPFPFRSQVLGFRDRHGPLQCAFCQKYQGQVKRLISGPDGVCICDECVTFCYGVIMEELQSE